MNDTRSLQVPLTTEEITVRAKELSEILEQRSGVESAMKCYATSCKKEIAEMDIKINSLCQVVSSGKEYRQVDVTEKPNYERGLMETFRLDTGEIVDYRELKESEKTRKLFPDQDEATEAEADAMLTIMPDEAANTEMSSVQ